MIIEFVLLAAVAAQQVQSSPAPSPTQPPAPASPGSPAAPAQAPPARPAEAPPEVDQLGAPYKEYVTHDVSAAIGMKPGDDGQLRPFVVMKVVDRISADLAAHALHFPTTFRSPEERKRAEVDVLRLATLLDTVVKREPGQPDDASSELLLKLAMLWTISCNLDMPGSVDQAIAMFERLLAREPEHRWANFHYGSFLAAIPTRRARAEPYLQKALQLGLDDARWQLAQLHAAEGDETAALQDLQAWLKLHPEDARAKALVETIEAARAERALEADGAERTPEAEQPERTPSGP